jgi:hypothetical protein
VVREPPRRFGPDFVVEHRRRYGKRPPEARQLTYDIAVDAEYASWRQWLDEQLDQLPAEDADAMARRIWLDEHFWTVNFELAAGAGLRAAGLGVVYEKTWDGVTPDWTVLSESTKPAAFVEVHTDNPPKGTFAQMRAWHGLVERIKKSPFLLFCSWRGPQVPTCHRMPVRRRRSRRISTPRSSRIRQPPCSTAAVTPSWLLVTLGEAGSA